MDKARLMAVTLIGSTLHALTLSNCRLRVDDKAVSVAVGLRLGANICKPHKCPRCAEEFMHPHVKAVATDPLDTAASTLNDLVWRGVSTANIPATKEPSGLFRSDGKRPDGLTLIPWKNGRCVAWDVTVTDSLAQRHEGRQERQLRDRWSSTGSWRSHTLSYQLTMKLWDQSITLVSNSSVTLEGALLKCLATTARAPSCSNVCQ